MNDKMNKCDMKSLGTILAGVALTIVIYWAIMNIVLKNSQFTIAQKDFMNQKIININLWKGNTFTLSMWPVSHFILFFVLGYFFPNCWVWIFIAGAVWEILEFVVGYIAAQRNALLKTSTWTGIQYKIWWGGSWADLLFNAAGLAMGIALSKITH